ncbi:MAG: GLUG motif-containing protein [Sedimentisphaerales bacterium]
MCKINASKIPAIVALLLSFFIFPNSVQAKYSGGSGDPNDPYQLANSADLLTMAADANDYSKHFVLTADINLTSYSFTTAVIAPDTNNSDYSFEGTAFTGVFDGNGHKISNLTIDTNGAGNNYLGLFGYTSSGQIKNLRLEDVNIAGDDNSIFLGGLVGLNDASISNCRSTGTVTGGGDSEYIGGLVGYNDNLCSISYCHSTGAVTGGDNSDYLGGLAGINGGNITECYSTGTVTSGDNSSHLGGLAGLNGINGNTSNCYSTGAVTGGDNSSWLGGLMGYNNDGNISNCYSMGAVSGGDGSSFLGGLAGYNSPSGSISNCYAKGIISGSGLFYFGGLVGYNNSGAISSCYFLDTGPDANNGVGTMLADKQMKQQSSFIGWDFVGETINGPNDIWWINKGVSYPKLFWQLNVTKCTVTAGSKDYSDKISFSGTMCAKAGDFNDADAVVRVTINSDDIVSPCVQTFLVDASTFKKGKYNYSKTINGVKKSFTYDVKTHKFAFSASNLDLSGLGCPVTIEIEIGNFIATAEIDEAIVNGPKVPIPIQLMMGVRNTLRVDKCQVKHGSEPNTDQFSVKGGFAFENQRLNMAAKDLVVTLGTQTFTIPAGSFKTGKGKFTCSKAHVDEGGIADAAFNFNMCSFILAIKNTSTITADSPFNFLVAEANSMLDGAVTYDGTFPPLSSIDYPTKDGNTLTLTVAYAGFVVLDVNSDADVETVLDAIEANGGAVVAALPAAGLYLVQVTVGQEAAFLTEMYDYPWVEDGSPASPAVQGAVRVLDWDDLSRTSFCSKFHMTGVSEVAGRLGGAVSETDVRLQASDITLLSHTLLLRMQMDEISGNRTVYNLSLQSAASGTVASNLDRSNCTDGYCRTIRHQQILFYRAFLSGMEEMSQKNPDVLNNAVVTIIAGNSGMDLDNEIAALKYRYPNAFKHVVIVGGTDAAGNIDNTLSHLSDNSGFPPDMVYARGRGVHVGTSLCDGTSFAGPEVSAVLDYIWKQNPFMTSDKVVEIFRNVVYEQGSDNKVPQDANGRTTTGFLDLATEMARAVPPPPSCIYLISPAAASFGSDGGSGSMTVTTLSDCPWTAVSNNSWITAGSSGGNGFGTVGYSVAANVNNLSRTGTLTIAGKTFTVNQAKRIPPKYVGSFIGSTTSEYGACQFNHNVSGTGTITLTGSTTGTFKVAGTDHMTVLSGEGCRGSTMSASYSGPLTIDVDGKSVSASVVNEDGTSADFTGTINDDNTIITGTLILDAPVFDNGPIVGGLTLNKQ